MEHMDQEMFPINESPPGCTPSRFKRSSFSFLCPILLLTYEARSQILPPVSVFCGYLQRDFYCNLRVFPVCLPSGKEQVLLGLPVDCPCRWLPASLLSSKKYTRFLSQLILLFRRDTSFLTEGVFIDSRRGDHASSNCTPVGESLHSFHQHLQSTCYK